MNLLETFSTLDEIYDSYLENNNSLTEGQSMPYALLVKSGNTWSVYKGLHSEPTTEEELAELDMFLKDKPEYSEVKVIPSSDIYKYVKKTNENLKEHYLSRDEIISKLKALGRQYYFNKYTDEQLYCILEKEEKKVQDKLEANQAQAELIKQQLEKEAKPVCDECGCTLTDGGYCPVCDDGEEDLFEGIFDGTSNLNSWVVMPSTSATPQQTTNALDAQNTSTNNTNSAGGYIVTIMYDGHKLRARADDGVHGRANVAFPTVLRNHNGQQYEVENLIWNGKNYRASGKIKPVSSVANTQNINENIIKENYEMNFQTILEELDRLYDEDFNIAKAEEAEETEIAEACTKSLTEDDDEVLVDDEPIIEDEAPIDAQLVLECSKCGALVVKTEADVDTDEETGLANTGDACQYCEAEEGYKVIGTFTPYDTEAEEEVLESLTEGKLIDNIKKVATRVGADAATILRGFAELGDTITNRNSKFYDFAEYVENKAVLKALMSGNEKVMNTLTKEDIEGLEQAIAAYEKAKAAKKSGTANNQAESDSELDEGIFDKFKKKKKEVDEPVQTKPQPKKAQYKDTDWVVLADRGSGAYRYTYSGYYPKSDKHDAEKDKRRIDDVHKTYGFDKNPATSIDHFVTTYGEAKRLVGRPFKENLNQPLETLDEGIFDLVKNPLNVFNESATPHTIRGYEKGNLEFSSTVAQELKSKFNGVIEQVKTDQGVEDLWVDTDGKAKAAERYVAKQYPDSAFSYDEYDMILGKKDLDELFNTKINVDARGFGGSGNDVDII